jgi:hypothetical protein
MAAIETTNSRIEMSIFLFIAESVSAAKGTLFAAKRCTKMGQTSQPAPRWSHEN